MADVGQQERGRAERLRGPGCLGGRVGVVGVERAVDREHGRLDLGDARLDDAMVELEGEVPNERRRPGSERLARIAAWCAARRAGVRPLFSEP